MLTARDSHLDTTDYNYVPYSNRVQERVLCKVLVLTARDSHLDTTIPYDYNYDPYSNRVQERAFCKVLGSCFCSVVRTVSGKTGSLQ